MAGRNRQHAARIERHRTTVHGHIQTAADKKERFVFCAVRMGRTLLPVKHEKILAAVAGLHLVGDPELDQADAVELAQPEIEHQRLDRRHGDLPRLDLSPEGFQRLVFFRASAGYLQALG